MKIHSVLLLYVIYIVKDRDSRHVQGYPGGKIVALSSDNVPQFKGLVCSMPHSQASQVVAGGPLDQVPVTASPNSIPEPH